VQMVYISEAWTQQAAIQGEDADMLLLDLGQAAYDLTQMGFECIYRPSGIVVLIPDSANPDSPFADKRVREAIEYAIDKEGLVAAKGYGFIDPAYQQALAGTLAYDPDFQGGRTYDVAKAKQLLADAGYPDGFTYNIIVTPTGMDRDMMVAVQSYLSKVGIEVTLDFVEYAKYLEYRYGEFPGNILAQPTGMWPNYNQHVGAYWAQTSNLFLSLERTEGLQALYDESSTLTEVDADMLREIASMIYEDAMVIPLYGAVSGAIVQDYVHDTGYLEGGVHFQAQPENAWISK